MTTKLVPALILLAIAAIAAAGDPPTKFKITTKKKDDSVEVRADKDKATFTERSPFGISNTVIERQSDAWPNTVVLRLHLKGLESFRVANGKVKLDAAAGIQDGKAKVRQWKDGKEDAPLTKREEPVVDGDPHSRQRRETGEGAQGRLFRGGGAEDALRREPEDDHERLHVRAA